MQFTTVRSKEKDYDIYLKLEKLSQQEHEKNVAIQRWKKLVPSYLSLRTIWREKKVDPCYLCSSQLFEARKKIMTSI